MGIKVPVGSLRLDDSITRQKVRPGTARRILPYARQYRWMLLLLLLATTIDAAIAAATPLMLGTVIDRGIVPHRLGVVIILALVVAGLGLADAAATYLQ